MCIWWMATKPLHYILSQYAVPIQLSTITWQVLGTALDNEVDKLSWTPLHWANKYYSNPCSAYWFMVSDTASHISLHPLPSYPHLSNGNCVKYKLPATRSSLNYSDALCIMCLLGNLKHKNPTSSAFLAVSTELPCLRSVFWLIQAPVGCYLIGPVAVMTCKTTSVPIL